MSGQKHVEVNSAPPKSELDFGDASGEFSDLDNKALQTALEKFAENLKREFIFERERERARVQKVFKEKVALIELQANQKVKEKLLRARSRDKAKLTAREKRNEDLFAKINRLAAEVADQKYQLQRCHEKLRRKLVEGGKVQLELVDIGIQLEKQLDALGSSLLDRKIVRNILKEGL